MKKYFHPTVLDFHENHLFSTLQVQRILSLIGTEVELVPNRDPLPIGYGKYKGQLRWEIGGHRDLLWFPTEDFTEEAQFTAEETTYLDMFIQDLNNVITPQLKYIQV